jgi:hypothetical protein
VKGRPKRLTWVESLAPERVNALLFEKEGTSNELMEANYYLFYDEKTKFPPSSPTVPLLIRFSDYGDGFGGMKEGKPGDPKGQKDKGPKDKKFFCMFGLGVPDSITAREKEIAERDKDLPADKRKKSIGDLQKEFFEAIKDYLFAVREFLWKQKDFLPQVKGRLRVEATENISLWTKRLINQILPEEIEIAAKDNFFKRMTLPLSIPAVGSQYFEAGPVFNANHSAWIWPDSVLKSKKKPKHSRSGSFANPVLQNIYNEMVKAGYVYNAPLVTDVNGHAVAMPADISVPLYKAGDLSITDFTFKVFSQKQTASSIAHYGVKAFFGGVQVIAQGKEYVASRPAFDSDYAMPFVVPGTEPPAKPADPPAQAPAANPDPTSWIDHDDSV